MTKALGFLVHVTLPTALGVLVWYGVAEAVGPGLLGPTGDMVLLASAVPIVALASSVALTRFVRWYQSTVYPKPEKPLTAKERALRTVLGGIVVPAVVLTANALVPMSGSGTVLQRVTTLSVEPAGQSLVDGVATSVITARSVSTKRQGVRALVAVRTPESLAALVRVLGSDLALLADRRYRSDLTHALARFGSQAEAPLVALFLEYEERMRDLPGEPAADLHTANLRGAFQDAREDVMARGIGERNEALMLAALDSAEASARASIGAAERALIAPDTTSALLDVILETFLAEATPGPAAAELAGRVAADERHTLVTRALALRLSAQSAAVDPQVLLTPYLQSEHEPLRRAAMRAIADRAEAMQGGATHSEEAGPAPTTRRWRPLPGEER